jgi:hypothetical protein
MNIARAYLYLTSLIKMNDNNLNININHIFIIFVPIIQSDIF